MKKNRTLSLFLLLLSNFVFAQNGIQTINMPSGFAWNQIRAKNCMLATQNDFVYVGFQSIGLGIWNGSSWTMKDSTDWNVPSNNVKALAFHNDTLWIGTTAGLVYTVGANSGFFRTSNSAIASDTINTIFATDGKVWAGTPRGLSRISGGTITTYNTSTSSLTSDNINCLAGTPDGSYLWLGNNTGIAELHNNIWTNYDAGNSILPAGGVTKMDFDGNRLVLNCSASPYLLGYQPGQFTPLNNGPAPLIQVPSVIESSNNGTSYTSQANGLSLKFAGSASEFFALPNAPASLMSLAPSGQYLWYTKAFTGPVADSVGAKLRRVDLSVFQNDPLSPTITQANVDLSNQILDKNNLRSMVRGTGEMFWERSQGSALCEFPKGSGKNLCFANALWLGGIDGGGQIHLAAQTYRQTGDDWWPGPLDPTNGTTNSATTAAYTKAWKIDKNSIEEFKFQFQLGNVGNGNYQPHPSILDWPASNPFAPSHQLAAFVDVNGDGNYDPINDGDYPKIEGDQAIFWVMNDNFAPHTESGGAPLKAEVHAMAFSYDCNNLPDSLKILNATNFFRYKVINRSASNYSSCIIGLWNDPDMGDYSDDYIATDSIHNTVYVYNADANDGTGIGNSYGTAIPIGNFQILKGPRATDSDQIDNNNNGIIDEPSEECLLSGSMFFKNMSGVSGNPSTTSDFFNYMNQNWKDSTTLTFGGDGYQTGNGSARFCFSGSPWNPAQWNCTSVSDYRILSNIGTFNLDAGDTVEMVWTLSSSFDSLLAWGTQPYYQHAESDRANVFSWFRNNGTTPCSGQQMLLGLSNLPALLCEAGSLNLQINSNIPLPPNSQVIIQREGNNFSFFQPVNIDTVSMSGTQQNISLPYNLLGSPVSEITLRVFLASTGISSPAYTIPVVNLPEPDFSITNQQLNALPLTTQFTNTTQNASGYDFTWFFGDGYSQQNNAVQVSYSYITNGVYNASLTITDPVSGCQRSNYNPNDPANQITCNAAGAQNCAINISTQPSGTFNTCNGGFVNIQAISVPPAAILQWFRNGIALGGETNPTLFAQQGGWYSFSATLPDGCSALSPPVQLNFNQTAGAPPFITATGSSGQCGIINLTLSANGSYPQYQWSNGATGQTINVNSAGTYSVTGQNPGCDQISAPFQVSGTTLPSQDICVATMEPQSNSSLIIWEKPLSLEIDSFRVLRETPLGSNNWQMVGSTDYNDLSELQDAAASFSSANRYSMVVVDTCGGISALSVPTKTIFLSVGPGVGVRRVLSWSLYDAATQNNGKYLIYSGNNPQNMNLIDSVPSIIGFYEDVLPVNGINTVYRVEKRLNKACTSSRNSQNLSSSNIAGSTILSPSSIHSNAQSHQAQLILIPNPNKGQFTIETNLPDHQAFWWMTDISGRRIGNSGTFSGGKTQVGIDLPSGIYFVHTSIGQTHLVSKVIIL